MPLPNLQTLIQMSIAQQQEQERAMRNRMWQLEDQTAQYNQQKRLSDAILERQQTMAAEKEGIASKIRNQTATGAIDLLANVMPEQYMGPTNQAAATQQMLSGADPNQQIGFVENMIKYGQEESNPSRMFPGLKIETIKKPDGKNYQVMTWLNAKTQQPEVREIGLSKEDEWALKNRLISAVRTGRLGDLEAGEIIPALQYEAAAKREVSFTYPITNVDPSGAQSTEQRLYSYLDGQDKLLATGTKQPRRWPVATENELTKTLVDNGKLLQSLEQLETRYKDSFLTYGGQFEAWAKNIWGKVDPKYKDQFTSEINEFNGMVQRAFDIYRKQITGAQAAYEELVRLQQGFLSKQMSPMQFVANMKALKQTAGAMMEETRRALKEGPEGYRVPKTPQELQEVKVNPEEINTKENVNKYILRNK